MYEAGELAGAINRIIEDMNHAFLASVLTRDFLSHDLGLSARNLRKERNPEKRTTALDKVDTEAVTQRLMNILDIRNRQEQTVPITKAHVVEIKESLTALDLIVDYPIETTEPSSKPVEHILFTQPGMRYCQAQALVHALMKDELFLSLSEKERETITSRILEEVRGRMLEDMILLETSEALDSRYKVCKLQFASGEGDHVAMYEKDSLPFEKVARNIRDANDSALVHETLDGENLNILPDDSQWEYRVCRQIGGRDELLCHQSIPFYTGASSLQNQSWDGSP